jgi:hypothetical protein
MKPIVIRKMPKEAQQTVVVRIGHVLRWRMRLALWLVRLGLTLIDWQLHLRETDGTER